MTSSGTSAVQQYALGTVNGVTVDVALTRRPWVLDIDAIVLSVGDSYGSLARTVRKQFPDAPWKSIPLDSIKAGEPATFELPTPDGLRLRWAILATPHGPNGPTTLAAIEEATRTAVLAANAAGARAVGLPLLATGLLGVPPHDIAQVMVPEAIRVLSAEAMSELVSVIFFSEEAGDVSQVQAVWQQHAGTPAEIPPPPAPETPEAPEAPEAPKPAETVFSAVELAGGMASDLVDPNACLPLDSDHLGMKPYVSMLATVIAARETPLPLSVGIFGEWGAGKSTFMGMLRGQVETLSKSPDDRYCDEIAQIGFNAWHYADANLWASLGDEIFRQLAEPPAGPDKRAERLRTELAERLEQRGHLEAATQQARETAAALQADVDAAEAGRRIAARNLITALKNSRVLRKELRGLWFRLGVRNEVEQGRLLAEQMRGTLSEADTLRRAPWDRVGKISLAAAVVLLLAGVCAAAFVPAAKELLAWVSGAFTVVAGFGITVLSTARAGMRRLRALSEDLHAGMKEAEGKAFTQEMAGKVDALRKAEADQRVAEAQLNEVVSRVGELGRQLAELTPGRRLYAFLAERAQGAEYSGSLGLISTIRKDFEQLVKLMKEWRQNPEHAAGRRPLDRIVLYIDDLDRCSPRQVVDVLQAVHLLLAFELFVVVVGVDPRWLLRSLCSHYDELLQGESADRPDGWHVTPEDYLEKILNIPLVLPTMASGSLESLVRGIAGVVEPAVPVADMSIATNVEVSATAHAHASAEELSVEPHSAVAAQLQPEKVVEIPRPLTEPEIALLSSLDLLVDTPRDAKRLINLYRMLRATRDLSDASTFLGDTGRPGEYQAVVVLLGLLTAHARLLGRVLDTPPDKGKRVFGGLVYRVAATRWPDFVAGLEPRRDGDVWANGVAGILPEHESLQWTRLHRGLARVSEKVTLEDLSTFQIWVPRIRRFSYVLSPISQVGAGIDGGGE